jgi:hypothetical protein
MSEEKLLGEREYHLYNCGGKGKARRRFVPKINGIISVKP